MSTDLAGMFQMLEGYRHQPAILLAATAGVVWYACHKFNTPTDQLSNDETILPPRNPAVQTTYLRYCVGLGLYVTAWLLFFGGFAFSPDLLGSVLYSLESLHIDLGPLSQGLRQLLSDGRDHLPLVLPLVAFVFMYTLGKAPGFSAVEQSLRDWFNEIARIPLEARRMSSRLRQVEVQMSQAFLNRLADDTWSGNLRKFRRGLYDDWVKLRYLAHQIESWPAQPDYSRFDLRYARERTALLAEKSAIAEDLRRLDAALAEKTDAANPVLDGDAQRCAAKLTRLLCNFTTFICYGVLSSFSTERARNEALQCIGYPVTRSGAGAVALRPEEEFPLDATALTLLLLPVFAATALSASIFLLLPNGLFGGGTPAFDQLGFAGCLRWGFWGTTMHFGSVIATLSVRRALRGTALRAWLEAADPMDRPYGLYFFGGVIGFVSGGIISLAASVFNPTGFTFYAFSWGSITSVTGASVIWHIDSAKRAIAERYERTGPSLVHLLGAEPDWRIPAAQGAITAAVGLLTYFYRFSILGGDTVDWKFCAFIVVGTGIVGAFLGQHLHRCFWRREIRKHAIDERAPTLLAATVAEPAARLAASAG